MAKKGFRYPKYNILNEKENMTVGKVMAEGIKADVKINTGDVKMYADDTVSEAIKEFKDGALTLEIDDIKNDVLADILGHKLVDGVLTASADDINPFCRVGFIIVGLKKKIPYFRVLVLPKVQFGIPDESFETSGESTTLKSTTIVANIFRSKNSVWKIEKTFDNIDNAVAWLDEMLNVGMLTITSAEGATTGKTKLTITPTKTAGNSYKYIVGATVTLPSVGDVVDGTYTAWDGSADITSTAGQEICVVEVDAQNIVVLRGKTTAVVKA